MNRLGSVLLPLVLVVSVLAPLGMGHTTISQPPSTESADVHDVCREIDPNDAQARGRAVVARVRSPVTNQEIHLTQSSVVGPGDDAAQRELTPVKHGNLVELHLLRSQTQSRVQAGSLNATSAAMVEVANVSLLDGMVKAKLIKAQGRAWTTMSSAEESGNGTALTEVTVNGVVHHVTGPNMRIPLPESLFGDGSYVGVYERKDNGFFPGGGIPLYRSNVTITMLHVVTTKAPVVEIAVAEVFAHAQTPTPYCSGIQSVGASAYVARIRPPPAVTKHSTVVGFTKIPQTGGYSRETYTDLVVPVPGESRTINIGAAESRASGKVVLGNYSQSSGVTKLTDVCVFKDAEGNCFAKAELIRSESHSRAYQDPNDPNDVDAWSWGSSRIVNLTIGGTDICKALNLEYVKVGNSGFGCNPPKNAPPLTIGPCTVWFNKRFRDMDPEGHTEYWVYAVILKCDGIAEVRLGGAYSRASYGTTDD